MQASAPVVQTRSGPVAGVREQSYFAFLGVPYAASPTGQRWLRGARQTAQCTTGWRR